MTAAAAATALAPERLLTGAEMLDLEEIGDLIAADSPARALLFVQQLRKRCQELCGFPKAYPLRSDLAPDIRIMALRHYLICYSLHPDWMVVERIVQGSRDVQALFR
jgi:toxin ParE1/3/4